MRTKLFHSFLDVSGEFYRSEDGKRLAMEKVARNFNKPLRGPRGGTYEVIPDWPMDWKENYEAGWDRDIIVVRGSRWARYRSSVSSGRRTEGCRPASGA